MKIWRVQLARGTKVGMYKRGSKTYKDLQHAEWAYQNFVQQGKSVKLLEAEVPEPIWYTLKES